MKTLEYSGRIKELGGTVTDYCEVVGIASSVIYGWKARNGRLQDKKPIPKTFPAKISDEKRAEVLAEYDFFGDIAGAWTIARMVGGISVSSVGEIIRSVRPYLLRHRRDVIEKIRQGSYEFLKSNVCWGWDATELIVGKSKMMLSVLRDECSGYIFSWLLTSTVTAEHVRRILCDAIEKFGKPLVLKSDNDTALNAGLIKRLLEIENIIALPGPAHYAKYQSHHERANSDVHQLLVPYEANPCLTYFEMVKHVETAINFLNNVKPRMNFNGKTSAEMFNYGQIIVLDINRSEIIRWVKEIEESNQWAFPGKKGMKKLHRYAIIEVLKNENFLKVEPRIPQSLMGTIGVMECSETINQVGQLVKQLNGQFLQ